MIRGIFSGKKKFLTIPIFVIVGLAFFPIALGSLVGYLINKKVANKKVRYSLLSLVALPTLFVGSAWIAVLSSGSGIGNVVEIKTQQESVVAPNLRTEVPTSRASELVVLTPSPSPLATLKPSPKPSPTKVATPKPTLAAKTLKTEVVSEITPAPTMVPQSIVTTPPTVSSNGSYECNCGKTCPNISSCEEAQYLLNVCGCGARDADKDGIACDGAPLNCQ